MPKIDWFFEHEAEHFGARLQSLVLEIHRLAATQLEVVYKAELESAGSDGSLEEDELASLENYLKGEQDSQQGALSTMALTMLASLIESFLDEARTRLDVGTFPAQKTYPGEGVLLKRVSEFRQRFGINLTSLRCFDSVREVVLARNSCVHKGGHPSADYLEQTSHRFLEEIGGFQLLHRRFRDEDRLIRCSVETLREVVAEVSQFATGLHAALNEIRRQELSKDQKPVRATQKESRRLN
jgi:hypothetical protein